MKLKTKILAPALSVLAAAAVVIPTATVVSQNTNRVNTNSTDTPVVVNENLFKIENGRVEGFKDDVTQEQINAYVRENGNVFALPACKSIGANAFKNVNLPFQASIEIDPLTETIEPYAFFGCTAESVIFKGSLAESRLNSIGDDAFAFCNKLTSFTFPKSLRMIGRSAFFGCRSLRTLDFSEYRYDDGGIEYADLEGIDKSIDRIGEDAFAGTYTQGSQPLTIQVYEKLPEKISPTSFDIRMELSNLALKIADTTDAQWYASGATWLQGRVGADGQTFGIDISFDVSAFKVNGSIIEDVVLTDAQVAAKPYNALLVDNRFGTITGIAPAVWQKIGYKVHDLDLSESAIVDLANPLDPTGPFIPANGTESYAPNLENVKLHVNTNRIGNHSFFHATNLKWINLNDCPNIKAFGDFAFAGCRELFCFGNNPIENIPDAENPPYLILNTTGLSLGIGAFFETGLQAIKFAGDGNITFTEGTEGKFPGDLVFAHTPIWALDFSEMEFHTSVETTNGNVLAIASDCSASRLFKSFMVITNPGEWRHGFFDQSFKNVVEDKDKQVINKILVPKVIHDGTPLSFTPEALFNDFNEVKAQLGENWEISDKWKETILGGDFDANSSFRDGLVYESGNKEQLENNEIWHIQSAPASYTFGVTGPHMDIVTAYAETLPVDGQPFTFHYEVVNEAFALDFANSQFFVGGQLIADKTDITHDSVNKTITMAGSLITGDVQFAPMVTPLTAYTLTAGSIDEKIGVKEPLPMTIVNTDRTYEIHLEFNEKGYSLDRTASKIQLAGGSTVHFEFNENVISFNGRDVTADATITLVAAVKTLEVKGNGDKGIDWDQGPQTISLAQDFDGAFPIKAGYEFVADASSITDPNGGAVEAAFSVKNGVLHVAIAQNVLVGLAEKFDQLVFTLQTRQPRPVYYNFIDFSYDKNVTNVAVSGQVEKGKQVVITVTSNSDALVLDEAKSEIMINNVNVIGEVGVTIAQTGVTITITIDARLVLGDIFTSFLLTNQ